VPFGPHATISDTDCEPSVSPTTSREPPPSADDFWGERSASIHGAVQAPVVDSPVQAPVVDSPSSHPRVPSVYQPRRRARRGVRRRVAELGRWRITAGACLAVALAAVTLLGFGVFGTGNSSVQPPGAPKVDVAAVVSNGVSKMVQRGLSLVDAGAARRQSAGSPPHRALPPRRPRRTPHPHAVFKPVHAPARQQARAPIVATPSPAADMAQAAPTTTPSTVPTYHPVNVTRSGTSEASSHPVYRGSSPPARPASSPPASTVAPTGQSGALGPIQSPNG
jgi:hypothetical protein